MCECANCVATGPDQWASEKIRNLMSFAQIVPPPASPCGFSVLDFTEVERRRLRFARSLAQIGKIGEDE